jgi:hypothetical protein
MKYSIATIEHVTWRRRVTDRATRGLARIWLRVFEVRLFMRSFGDRLLLYLTLNGKWERMFKLFDVRKTINVPWWWLSDCSW